MKLRTREIYLFVGVISLALALPISLFVALKSQETRSEAAEVRYYVNKHLTTNSPACPSDKVGYAACFIDTQAAVLSAQKNGSGKTVIEIEPTTDWNDANTEPIVIESKNRTAGTGGYEIVLTSSKYGTINAKFNIQTNSGKGHAVDINDPNLTLTIKGIEYQSNQTNSTIHVYNAKALNLRTVGVYNSKAAGVYYGDENHKEVVINGTVEGCTFIGNYRPGVSVHGASNVTIKNSAFKDHQHAGVDATDTATLKIYGSTFDNNNPEVLNYNSNNYSDYAGILGKGSSRIFIESSIIKNHSNIGILLIDKSYSLIKNCLIKDCLNSIVLDSPDNQLPANSSVDIYNSIILAGADSVAQSGESLYVDTVSSNKNNIVNNIFRRGDNFAYDVSLIKGNFRFINNYVGNILFVSVPVQNQDLRRNIIGEEICNHNKDLIDISSQYPDNLFKVDPLFTTDGSYHLQTGSPAINAGDPAVLDPDGSRSDMGAWGGPDADWSPVFTRNLEKSTKTDKGVTVDDCSKPLTVAYKDYNDPARKFSEEVGSGALYEILSDGKYKSWLNVKTTGNTSDNVSIRVPEGLKDGKTHTLTFAAHNIYKYIDLDNKEIYIKQDNSLGQFMHVFTPEVTLTCGTATFNQPPTFGELPDGIAYRQIPFAYSYTVTDPENDKVTVTALIPSELDWLALNAETKTLTGTPTTNAALGKYTVKLTATDDKNNKTEKTFSLTVADKPTNAIVVNLDIDLQTKENDTNTQITVKVKDNKGKEILSTNAASNADGKLFPIVISNETAGDYTIWIKPRGYLARKITKSLVVGDNNVKIEEVFIAGDLSEDNTYNIVKAADYAVFVQKYFQVDEYRNLDGSVPALVNAKDHVIILNNWFKVGESL